jgi:hypothetical protein
MTGAFAIPESKMHLTKTKETMMNQRCIAPPSFMLLHYYLPTASGPAPGAIEPAALVASCFLGALPPVKRRAAKSK